MFFPRRVSSSLRFIVAPLLLSLTVGVIGPGVASHPGIVTKIPTPTSAKRPPYTSAAGLGELTDFSSPNGYVLYERPSEFFDVFNDGYWEYSSGMPGFGFEVYQGEFDTELEECVVMPFRLQCEGGNIGPNESYTGVVAAAASTSAASSAMVSASFQTLLGPTASVSIGASDSDGELAPFSGSVQLDASDGADFVIVVYGMGYAE